jgi:hypothetical protein
MKDLKYLFEGLYVDIVPKPGTYELNFYVQPHVDIFIGGGVEVTLDKKSKYLFHDLAVEPKIKNSIRLKEVS